MGRAPKGMIKEGGGVLSRGYVPDRTHGIRDRVYSSYLQGLDPINNKPLQLALAASPDNRFNTFLERVKSGKYRRVSLSSLAKACDISLAEFQGFWQTTAAQAAIALAQTESINVVSDMIEDSRSKDEACPRCDGLCWVAAPFGLPPETPGYRSFSGPDGKEIWIRDCPTCQKTGFVTKPGDSFSRGKVLDMAGVIPQKGPLVNISQSFAGASHASAVGALSAMTIDVPPVEVSETPDDSS